MSHQVNPVSFLLLFKNHSRLCYAVINRLPLGYHRVLKFILPFIRQVQITNLENL